MQKSAFVSVLILVLLVLFGTSCSDYQKLLKSTDYDLKYVKAKEYFDNEDYLKAASLYEELMTLYRGTDKAEDVNYHYAYCYYYQQDYIMAGYYFNNFVNTFPNSPKTEECAFMVAYCYYKDSPAPSLDQANTYKAIDELQLFLNKYPHSKRKSECNKLIDELHNKLVEKSFNGAKLYFELGDYKASITALNNSLRDYPDTQFREDLLFLILKSSYELARNSVIEKINDRYKATIEAYHNLIDEFPETKHLRDADRIYAAAKKALNLE